MPNEGVGNLTVEVYDGNSVVKVHNAIVKITGHYKPPEHFKKPVAFADMPAWIRQIYRHPS